MMMRKWGRMNKVVSFHNYQQQKKVSDFVKLTMDAFSSTQNFKNHKKHLTACFKNGTSHLGSSNEFHLNRNRNRCLGNGRD